ARQCKNKYKGVRHYQDSKDKSSTSNLKTHATKCFGTAAVAAAIQGKSDTGKDGSIFAAFARRGQRPVTVSHRNHSNAEDREFVELIMAGHPNLDIPSHRTVSRDIHASFDRCRACISYELFCSLCTDLYLQEHPGRLNFAIDAWTSPNHRAFVAWTVYLEYEGRLLSFVLDIIEVPEV
ncbi:hypothetical protein BKA93DRAFT_716007, partial [Sparassis latifolia]